MSVSADELYDSIRGYLRVTSRVVSKAGGDINVDEKFTLRFTGSNSCPAEWIPWWKQPDIIFDNPRVFVRGTIFAEPVGGATWHNLPDKRLYPGESSSVDIEFEAKMSFPFVEKVAKAWILGHLDQDRFFRVWNFTEVHVPIEPT
jgi:hypothetical protein